LIEIDGAQQSGSGTLVRFGVAFAALLGAPLRVRNARAKRAKPGLRPQHVAAVRACAALCGGRVEGVGVGARDFTFAPGKGITGGRFEWDIGTAGSATMLALGILPVACFAHAPVVARITGGVFQDFAPSPFHLRHVLLPLLARMGASASLDVVRPGYVPGGAGAIELRVEPAPNGLRALRLGEAGPPGPVAGIALESHLRARRVAERMAQTCEVGLARAGLACAIERVHDEAAVHPGACLAVWTETASGGRIGADRAGARRRSSEVIGRFVARRLLADLETGASVDRHAADQLVLFAALARGRSVYRAPRVTEHVASNLWLAERFGAVAREERGWLEIDGLALGR
jgi:RNA 3'-terminal phosphate cyclase (ATP)